MCAGTKCVFDVTLTLSLSFSVPLVASVCMPSHWVRDVQETPQAVPAWAPSSKDL